MFRRKRLLGLLGGLTVVVAALAAVFVVRAVKEHERESQGESVVAFAREHPGKGRRIPLAVVREKLEHGKEAQREKISGPAQAQVDERAFPRDVVTDAQAQDARQAFLTQSAPGLADSFAEVGPFVPKVPREVTYTGAPTTNSGRVTALAVDPNCGRPGKGCRAWMTAAGGGIWRTDDALAASVSWTPETTGLTTGAFGSLVVDPTDPTGNTLYAGSGEPNGSSDSEAGVGLFRSTDGGRTWGLLSGSVPVARDRSIGSIAINPRDGTLWIGTDLARHGSSSSNGGRRTPPGAPQLGLYRSTDHGASFTLAFSQAASPQDPASGTDFFQGGVNKIVLDPRDPSTVYVAIFGHGIWRSSARLERGDAAFKQVFVTRNPADTTGDRTEFDLATITGGNGPVTRAYVGDSSDDEGISELWRSDKVDLPAAKLVATGKNASPWKLLSSPDPGSRGFSSYRFCQDQCGYDMGVYADPANPDTVILIGSMNYDELEVFGGNQRTNGRAVIRSTDAGVSFNDMTNDATVRPGADTSLLAGGVFGMHPDQHALAFDPFNTRFFFVGSDGGVVRVNGRFTDKTADCTARGLKGNDLKLCRQVLRAIPVRTDSLNDSLRTLQYQSVSLNPAAERDDLLGGTQDNGTWAFNPTGTPATPFDAFESVGGDGGQSAVDLSGPKIHTYFGPSMDANFGSDGGDTDSPQGWDYISQPLDEASADASNPEAFSFYVPLIKDPKVAGTLFTGGEFVWRTQDDGGDRAQLDAHCNELRFDGSIQCGDWQRIGAKLSANPGDYIVATERAPSDDATLWVGTRQGHLWVSHNANAADPATVNFTEIKDPALPSRFISSIHPDASDPNHAWISNSGYDAYTPATPGHVFEVRVNPDTGAATVTPLSFDIGDQPVTDLVTDDQSGDLYASTDFGVLRLPSGAQSWQKAANGMPIVAVYGLTVAPGSRLLYAATHGRGVWRVNLPGGSNPAPNAPRPGPGVAAMAGATATGVSAGPAGQGVSPQQQRSRQSVKASLVRVSRHGSRVTVRFRVDRTAKVRVVVRDRGGRTVARSPLRTVPGGRTALLHVRVPRKARGPLRISVHAQPEAKAPRRRK
ncbi:MAG: hypothetical protein QOH72_2047 [Solirubrobacteraceae bacterium]|nr:hypothetical protein [Solirubrobacteraceae bacterium]